MLLDDVKNSRYVTKPAPCKAATGMSELKVQSQYFQTASLCPRHSECVCESHGGSSRELESKYLCFYLKTKSSNLTYLSTKFNVLVYSYTPPLLLDVRQFTVLGRQVNCGQFTTNASLAQIPFGFGHPSLGFLSTSGQFSLRAVYSLRMTAYAVYISAGLQNECRQNTVFYIA